MNSELKKMERLNDENVENHEEVRKNEEIQDSEELADIVDKLDVEGISKEINFLDLTNEGYALTPVKESNDIIGEAIDYFFGKENDKSRINGSLSIRSEQVSLKVQDAIIKYNNYQKYKCSNNFQKKIINVLGNRPKDNKESLENIMEEALIESLGIVKELYVENQNKYQKLSNQKSDYVKELNHLGKEKLRLSKELEKTMSLIKELEIPLKKYNGKEINFTGDEYEKLELISSAKEKLEMKGVNYINNSFVIEDQSFATFKNIEEIKYHIKILNSVSLSMEKYFQTTIKELQSIKHRRIVGSSYEELDILTNLYGATEEYKALSSSKFIADSDKVNRFQDMMVSTVERYKVEVESDLRNIGESVQGVGEVYRAFKKNDDSFKIKYQF